jgi:hypothetical protein
LAFFPQKGQWAIGFFVPWPNSTLNRRLQLGHCWLTKPPSPLKGAVTVFKGRLVLFIAGAPFIAKEILLQLPPRQAAGYPVPPSARWTLGTRTPLSNIRARTEGFGGEPGL